MSSYLAAFECSSTGTLANLEMGFFACALRSRFRIGSSRQERPRGRENFEQSSEELAPIPDHSFSATVVDFRLAMYEVGDYELGSVLLLSASLLGVTRCFSSTCISVALSSSQSSTRSSAGN